MCLVSFGDDSHQITNPSFSFEKKYIYTKYHIYYYKDFDY